LVKSEGVQEPEETKGENFYFERERVGKIKRTGGTIKLEKGGVARRDQCLKGTRLKVLQNVRSAH